MTTSFAETIIIIIIIDQAFVRCRHELIRQTRRIQARCCATSLTRRSLLSNPILEQHGQFIKVHVYTPQPLANDQGTVVQKKVCLSGLRKTWIPPCSLASSQFEQALMICIEAQDLCKLKI